MEVTLQGETTPSAADVGVLARPQLHRCEPHAEEAMIPFTTWKLRPFRTQLTIEPLLPTARYPQLPAIILGKRDIIR